MNQKKGIYTTRNYADAKPFPDTRVEEEEKPCLITVYHLPTQRRGGESYSDKESRVCVECRIEQTLRTSCTPFLSRGQEGV